MHRRKVFFIFEVFAKASRKAVTLWGEWLVFGCHASVHLLRYQGLMEDYLDSLQLLSPQNKHTWLSASPWSWDQYISFTIYSHLHANALPRIIAYSISNLFDILSGYSDSDPHISFLLLPGIVPSSVVLTGFQVLSRVFLTWAITHSVREVRCVLVFRFVWHKWIRTVGINSDSF